jgi:hypothetical protein
LVASLINLLDGVVIGLFEQSIDFGHWLRGMLVTISDLRLVPSVLAVGIVLLRLGHGPARLCLSFGLGVHDVLQVVE